MMRRTVTWLRRMWLTSITFELLSPYAVEGSRRDHHSRRRRPPRGQVPQQGHCPYGSQWAQNMVRSACDGTYLGLKGESGDMIRE